MTKQLTHVHGRLQKLLIVAFVAIISLMPLLLTMKVDAAQLTARSLTLSSATPSASAQTYTYAFTIATAGDVNSIEFEACTTAVGTCSAPAGIDIDAGTEASRSGWTNANTFARNGTGGGGCSPGGNTNVLCIDRTDGASETAVAHTLGWNTQTNQSATNTSFFIRITLYSDTAWATPTDTGTVASATTQVITVNAAVAEVLNFCTGSTGVDDATTSVGAACANVSGTSINIGTLDTSSTNVSPVNTNGGDNLNAVAMIRTNASSGASVSYKAVQQSGTQQLGTLRISGATCNADSTTLTDQCIRAQGTTQSTFTAGAERFGMTAAAINCGSVSSYTCTFSSGTYNLVRNAEYDGDGGNTYPTDTGPVGGTTDAGYAWDQSGTADLVASSSTVIDDEALILKFASTPSITTPFGAYAAQADFIAVATY